MDELIISLPADKYTEDQIRLILNHKLQAPLNSIILHDGKLNFKFSPYKFGEDATPYTNVGTVICDKAKTKLHMLKILDQACSIRTTGLTNMFDLKTVQILANERDFYKLVIFLKTPMII